MRFLKHFISLQLSGNWQTYFDESVSLLSLGRNLASFKCTGVGSHSSPCMAYCVLKTRFHTGVEYCLFVLGFARAPSQINELLHTFLLLSTNSGAYWNGLSIEMKQSYEFPVVEEIMISPMKALLQDVSNPTGDVPPVDDGGDD